MEDARDRETVRQRDRAITCGPLVQKRPEDCWIGTYGRTGVDLAGATSRRDRGHDVVAVPACSTAPGILGSCSWETKRYVSPTVLEISSTYFRD